MGKEKSDYPNRAMTIVWSFCGLNGSLNGNLSKRMVTNAQIDAFDRYIMLLNHEKKIGKVKASSHS